MASLGDTGSGLRLGPSVGGASRGLDRVYIGGNMSPPNSFLRGILVNNEGRRFVNETAYNCILGRAIAEQPGGEARLILTKSQYRQAVRESLFSGWSVFRFFGLPAYLNMKFGGTKHASSVAGLAEACGMAPEVLMDTILRYNASLGGPDEFNKLAELREPIQGGGYYAINLSIPNKFAFTQIFTLGGLAVDETSGAVLRENGSPVAGLYAAGRTAFGLCSRNYISGLSIGDCVFTGRRAARHCLSEAVRGEPVATAA